jgi:hypothetical protein
MAHTYPGKCEYLVIIESCSWTFLSFIFLHFLLNNRGRKTKNHNNPELDRALNRLLLEQSIGAV